MNNSSSALNIFVLKKAISLVCVLAIVLTGFPLYSSISTYAVNFEGPGNGSSACLREAINIPGQTSESAVQSTSAQEYLQMPSATSTLMAKLSATSTSMAAPSATLAVTTMPLASAAAVAPVASASMNIRVTGTERYDYAYQNLALVNQEREKAGLGALEMNSSLTEAAMQRAAETTVYFSHTRPNGKDCFTVSSVFNSYYGGENAAVGYSTPTDALNGLMSSTGHRENILNGSWRSVGIGVFVHNGTYYWVQLFSTMSSTSPAQPSNATKSRTIELSSSVCAFSSAAIVSDSSIEIGETKSFTLKLGNVERGLSSWAFCFPDMNYGIDCSSSDAGCLQVSAGSMKGLAGGSVNLSVGIPGIVSAVKPITVGLGAPEVPIPIGVAYRTHVQNLGNQGTVYNGEISGTTGQGLRVESIWIYLTGNYSGGVSYQTYVQDVGWQDWKSNAVMSGTSGMSKRIEGIRIRLDGYVATKYDIYYRVYCESYGWLAWAKNGETAGSEGLGLRMEAIQIVLVTKDAGAPGNLAGITSASGSPTVTVTQKIETYTVTFVNWNGSVIATQKVNAGSGASAPANPTRSGYYFAGWDKSFNYVTSDLTVTALFSLIPVADPVTPTYNPSSSTYTVTFAPGEHGIFVTQTTSGISSGSTTPTPPDTACEPGWCFTGWSPTLSATVSGSVTYVAQWGKASYTVCFEDWNGTVLKTESVTHGGTATAPANPTRADYNFTGWDRAFTEVTADITVKAQYSEVQAKPKPDSSKPGSDPTLTGDQSTTTIDGQAVPLFYRSNWALTNFIMTIINLLAVFVLFVLLFEKRQDGKSRIVRLWPFIIAVSLAVAALVLFVSFDGMTLPMVLANQRTILHVVMLSVVALCTVFASVGKKKVRVEIQQTELEQSL